MSSLHHPVGIAMFIISCFVVVVLYMCVCIVIIYGVCYMLKELMQVNGRRFLLKCCLLFLFFYQIFCYQSIIIVVCEFSIQLISHTHNWVSGCGFRVFQMNSVQDAVIAGDFE